MPRRVRVLGIVLAAIGIAILLGFGGVALDGGGELQRARAARAAHPGNAMYDLRVLVAGSQFALLAGGAAAGGLLALQGATLVLLGRLAERLEAAGR